MRNGIYLVIILVFNLASNMLYADCKNLKSCVEWAQGKTGLNYSLGKLEKKNLKVDHDLNLSEGNADTIFSFILSQNELTRVKRDNGSYEIIALRDLKDFTFPIIKEEALKPSFDMVALEFFFSNKEKVKNAMIILKKHISKNGRIVQASDGSRVIVTDTGYQQIVIKNIAQELNN